MGAAYTPALIPAAPAPAIARPWPSLSALRYSALQLTYVVVRGTKLLIGTLGHGVRCISSSGETKDGKTYHNEGRGTLCDAADEGSDLKPEDGKQISSL